MKVIVVWNMFKVLPSCDVTFLDHESMKYHKNIMNHSNGINYKLGIDLITWLDECHFNMVVL